LPGEHHELGILLFCIAAISHGYQILYLGTDMPPLQLSKVVERTDVSAVLLSGTSISQWQDDIALALKDTIQSMDVPFLFGGELSEAHKEELESLGGFVLGSDHVRALERMESIIPAFSAK